MEIVIAALVRIRNAAILKLVQFYSRRVIKSREDVAYSLRGIIQLQSFDQFPEKPFLEIERISIHLTNNLLSSDQNTNITREEEVVLNLVFSGPDARSLISMYHHLTAFYYHIWQIEDLHLESLSKAKSYDESIVLVNYENFDSLRSKYKKVHKLLKKKVIKHQRKQILDEVWERMPTISISMSAIATFIGLFITLLYLGGYIYSKIFFSRLNIDANQYLDPLDFLVTGLNATSSAFLMLGGGAIIVFIIIRDKLLLQIVEHHYDPPATASPQQDTLSADAKGSSSSEAIHSYIYDIEKAPSKLDKYTKRMDIGMIIAGVSISITTITIAYLSGSGIADAIRLPISMIFPILLAWTGVMQLFEKPMLAYCSLVIVINFLLAVAVDGYEDADLIRNGECPSGKKVLITNDISLGENRCFIGATQSWVMEYDSDSQSARIVSQRTAEITN